jgi:hypothetical protein
VVAAGLPAAPAVQQGAHLRLPVWVGRQVARPVAL